MARSPQSNQLQTWGSGDFREASRDLSAPTCHPHKTLKSHSFVQTRASISYSETGPRSPRQPCLSTATAYYSCSRNWANQEAASRLPSRQFDWCFPVVKQWRYPYGAGSKAADVVAPHRLRFNQTCDHTRQHVQRACGVHRNRVVAHGERAGSPAARKSAPHTPQSAGQREAVCPPPRHRQTLPDGQKPAERPPLIISHDGCDSRFSCWSVSLCWS